MLCAFRATSDVFKSFLASAVWYATTLLSRKSLSMPVLMAKLMFSGMLPVALANFNASNFAATIPTTSPLGIQKRSAAVARLHGSADLQISGIVQDAAQRTDDARGYREIGGQQAVVGIADRHHAIA